MWAGLRPRRRSQAVMRLAIVLTIARKELREILRDRRTLLLMIGLPVVLYPLLMIGLSRLQEWQEAATEARASIVAVSGSLPESLRVALSMTRKSRSSRGPAFLLRSGRPSKSADLRPSRSKRGAKTGRETPAAADTPARPITWCSPPPGRCSRTRAPMPFVVCCGRDSTRPGRQRALACLNLLRVGAQRFGHRRTAPP